MLIHWAPCESDATVWNGSCKQEGSSGGCFYREMPQTGGANHPGICHDQQFVWLPENCLFFIFSYLTTDINNERSQTSRLIRSACQQLTFIESSSSVISNSNLRVCHEIVSVSVQPLLVPRCILGSSSWINAKIWGGTNWTKACGEFGLLVFRSDTRFLIR